MIYELPRAPPRNRHQSSSRSECNNKFSQAPVAPSSLDFRLDPVPRKAKQISANKTQDHNSSAPEHSASPKRSQSAWESGRRYMTKAGMRVRSKAEKIIADYLTESGIRFIYEPVLKVGGHVLRPDFYLLDYELPYEHFGLGTETYLRAADAKIKRYRQAGVTLIYTTFADEEDIEEAIVDKLAAATLPL